jgi:Flp pilus assembly protein protease CpaA
MACVLATTVWGVILSYLDCKTRRIPNVLTLGGAGAALALRLALEGQASFLDGFGAAAVAGAFLLLPFLMHGAGGGDVKMMFAAGAIVGWQRLLPMLWFTSVFGVIFGIGMILFGKLDASRLKHYLRCAVDWRYDRKAGRANLPPKESESVRIPFSVPITIGTVWTLLMCLR